MAAHVDSRLRGRLRGPPCHAGDCGVTALSRQPSWRDRQDLGRPGVFFSFFFLSSSLPYPAPPQSPGCRRAAIDGVVRLPSPPSAIAGSGGWSSSSLRAGAPRERPDRGGCGPGRRLLAGAAAVGGAGGAPPPSPASPLPLCCGLHLKVWIGRPSTSMLLTVYVGHLGLGKNLIM